MTNTLPITLESSFQLPLNTLRWILTALMLAVLPHVLHMPLWITVAFVLLVLWRYIIAQKQWPLPGTWIRLGLAFVLLLGVILSFRSLTIGRDAGVALLVGLLGLKLLEMRNLRDAMLLSFLSFFLIMTNFFYSQSIPTAGYLIIVMLVATGTLISLSDLNQALNLRQRLRLSTQILLQSIPLAIALFVLFPRIPGPLWGLPEDAYGSAASGFSGSMRPGSISNLSLSDAVAFRVEFFSEVPPPALRYWRGAVLWQTDGESWQPGRQFPIDSDALEQYSDPVDYAITLEPHHQRWLFSLDLPQQSPSELPHYLQPRLLTGHQIKTEHKISQRIKYRLQSFTHYRTTSTPNSRTMWRRLHRALQLPPNRHPQAKALAQSWQTENPDPRALVQKALDYFNQEHFFYTLSPPPLLNDPIDEFLFDSRKGFCEHYSAAFVTLMRAASVPARVVVGYQGGNMNPLGDFMTVRQRDAHAWAEVWLQGQGWVRVDPTGAVAPERVQRGLNASMPGLDNPLGLELEQNSLVMSAWRYVRNGLDMMNNSWNQWVLNYGQSHQLNLLKWLGLEQLGYRALTLVLFCLIGMSLLLIGLWLFSVRRLHYSEPIQAAYLQFCRQLARRGVERRMHEGPQDFARRASLALPQYAAKIQYISRWYIQLRYRKTPHTKQQQQFKQAVKQL